MYKGLLYVAVRDFSPVLPVQRDHDSHATAGRGLALVSALVSDYGVSDPGLDGKTVWFTIAGQPAEQGEDELLAAWADADWDLDGHGDEVAAAGGGRVWLLGLPPALWLCRQHHDALVRELVVHRAEHRQADVDVAAADRAREVTSTAVGAAVQQAQGSGER